MQAIAAAALIGLTLGLLGAGGSILTVPVLVYLIGHDAKVAIAESLIIVGTIALIAALPYAWQRRIDWKRVMLFGLPGMVGAYAGAWASEFVSASFQLMLFAVVMLTAAWLMFRPPRFAVQDEATDRPKAHPFWLIALEGTGVGVLTGLVGVGGGFMIVPALVLLGALPMRMAVATSLPIITLNAYMGFSKHLLAGDGAGTEVDWPTVGIFVAAGMLGTAAGFAIGARVDQRALRRIFAVFLVAIAAFIIVREGRRMTATASRADVRFKSPPVADVAVEQARRQGIN